MNKTVNQTGWKPLPFSLKIVFGLLVLWVIGSFLALPQRYEIGIPFMGIFINGLPAGLTVLFLDIIAPIFFLYAIWKRRKWGPLVAYIYIAIFIVNSLVAYFTLPQEMAQILGGPAMLIPAVFEGIILSIIYISRKYFEAF